MSAAWRSIPGFSRYEISDAGTIRRRLGTPGTCFRPGYPIKPGLKRNGHLVVSLWGDDERRHAHHVSRLVALAFLGLPPSPTHHAAHVDGNPRHNHPANLYWATPSQNQYDRARHGTVSLGIRPHNARFSDDQVREIRRLRSQGETLKAVAARFGTFHQVIHLIATRRRYRDVA